MNILDVIILVIIGLTALSGYRKGFILSFFSLLKIFLSRNTNIYNNINNLIISLFIFGLIKEILIIFIIYVLLIPVIEFNGHSFIAIKIMESTLGIYFYRPEILMNYLT